MLCKPKIIFTNEPIYFYRIARKESLTYSLYLKTHNIIILLKEIYKALNEKNFYAEYFKVFHIYAFVNIAYGLTCGSFSTKRTKYILLSIKRFLFSDNNVQITMSDKFTALIFIFFLNHARLYKITAFTLKYIRRLLSVF